jgi:hypothetical protein
VGLPMQEVVQQELELAQVVVEQVERSYLEQI